MLVKTRRLLVYRLVLCGALVSCAIAPTSANGQGRSALADLNGHLPRALNVPSDRIWVIAPLPTGLGVRRWSAATGWSGWNPNHPGPAGVLVTNWSESLAATYTEDPRPTVGGFVRGPQVNAVYGYLDNARAVVGVAVSLWDQGALGGPLWIHSLSTLIPPTTQPVDSFRAASGFGWYERAGPRVNVFGSSLYQDLGRAGITSTLRELFSNGTTWNFNDHGRPAYPGHEQVLIGPNSTVWDNRTKSGFVFVTLEETATATNSRDAPSPNLWLRQFGPAPTTTWQWIDLGNPYALRGTTFVTCNTGNRAVCARGMRAPVAVARYEGELLKIHVFVLVLRQTTQAPTNRQWVLWERHFDGSRWRRWVDHGPFPATVPVLARPQDPWQISPGPQPPFDLTSGVAYDQNGTLKVNLFGTTRDGRLMEYFWTGQRWQYGFNVPGPAEGSFRTISSAVHDSASFDFITIVGRVTGPVASAGEVWEYYWDSRVNQNWAWRRLFP